MSEIIDVSPSFTEAKIEQAFYAYKESKTDRYTGKVHVPKGADGVCCRVFEHDLRRNAMNISRRVIGGSYQFYPLRQIAIHKTELDVNTRHKRWTLPSGSRPNQLPNLEDHPCPQEHRILSIARIRDILVQKQLYQAISCEAERLFKSPQIDNVSFAYRPKKSVTDAARVVKKAYGSGYTWVYEADIVKFFDRVDHSRLFGLIDDWLDLRSVAGTLLRRYTLTDVVPFDTVPSNHQFGRGKLPLRCSPKTGIPQGGVLSGLLANLYLRDFDLWVMETLGRQYDIRYVRYADDFVILARDETTARAMFGPTRDKIASLKLQIHDLAEDGGKTAVRSIDNKGFCFVGFRFRGAKVRPKSRSISDFKLRIRKAIERGTARHVSHQEPLRCLPQLVEQYINPKLEGPEPEMCNQCGLPKDRRHSWMGFYATVINDWKAIRGLDAWIRGALISHFRNQYAVRLRKRDLKRAGLKSLISISKKCRSSSTILCQCANAVPSLTN